MIQNRNKPVLSYKEPWKQGNELNKFRSIISEVSSFVGNPVVKLPSLYSIKYSLKYCFNVVFLLYSLQLPTKDETSETIVRNLFSPFSCIRGSLKAKTGLFLGFII